MVRVSTLAGIIVLLTSFSSSPEAHAMGRGKGKDAKLDVFSGVYATTYTGPDLLDEAATLKICPKKVVIEILDGKKRIASEADTAAIDAALATREIRHVRVQMVPYSATEPAPYAPPIPDASAQGGTRVANFTYDIVTSMPALKGGVAVRSFLQGILEPSRQVEISTTYELINGVLQIRSETNNADLTLDLINRGQFISHSCELRKLAP